MKLLTEPRRPTWRDLIEDPTREGEADWLPYLASRAFSETG
jgi:hypothetical protein